MPSSSAMDGSSACPDNKTPVLKPLRGLDVANKTPVLNPKPKETSAQSFPS
jgi:hypothetical protein